MKRPTINAEGLITKTSPSRGIAFILGLGLVLWALVVLNPFLVTFSGENKFYNVLSDIAHENTWGLIFLTAGCITIYGVIKKEVAVLRLGLIMGFILWLLLSVMYAASDPSVTVVATNFVIAMMHGWLYLQSNLHPEIITHNTLRKGETEWSS